MTEKKQNDERKLVDGCIQNDRRCQEQLYRRFFPGMMSFVMRYTDDREVALEILNTGFLRVFKKLNTFSFQGSLDGWVRKLIFHSIADYFRNQAKGLQFLVLEEWDQPQKEHTLENFYAEDLMKMVDYLPPATQEVFRLFALEGYSHDEIGSLMNISSGTSKWHLSDARRRLKELLYQHQDWKHHAK